MKLILKEYLASLRERGDLDTSVLPNLLAEIGLNVLSTPMIGTRQYGVDIAAVGKVKDEDDQRFLYLFCIKAGNIGRSDWNSTPQSVRPALDEICDIYLKTRVSNEHADLPVKICLCCGGELEEAVSSNWVGYTKDKTTDKILYEQWNGDKLAGLMIRSLLAGEVLGDKILRDFRKAVAIVNEPGTCYEYTSTFLRGLLLDSENRPEKDQLLRLRQGYICIHAITAWALEAKNLECIYKVSELGMLLCWNVVRKNMPETKKRTNFQSSLLALMTQFVNLHLKCSESYLDKTAFAHCEKRYALSYAVDSQEPVDVNLSMFELLGRVAVYGIWADNCALNSHEPNDKAQRSLEVIVSLIDNNPTLNSPFRDDHMIEISLVMYLAQLTDSIPRLVPWLLSVAENTTFALIRNSSYPVVHRDYVDLLNHPENNDDEYRNEACSGSVLYPYLFVWLSLEASEEDTRVFCRRLNDMLPSCTYQAWFPDEDTEELVWQGETNHGVCLLDLSPQNGFDEISQKLDIAIRRCPSINCISAVRLNLDVMFLAACRHYRLPISPHFWKGIIDLGS